MKRRGVHHSGGLKAKRRWLKWRRYQQRCEALAGLSRRKVFRGLHWSYPAHPMLRGAVKAGSRYVCKGRYVPIGIRDVRP